jgi:hypothetical protein
MIAKSPTTICRWYLQRKHFIYFFIPLKGKDDFGPIRLLRESRQIADFNKNLQTEAAGGGGGAAGVLSEVTEDMESLGAGDIPTVIALVNRAAEQFNQRSEDDDI